MRRRSIVFRVVVGMVLVAVLSSLALAAGAAVTARILWQSHEKQVLRDTCGAFVRAVKAEAAEGNLPFEQAATETITESALAGYKIEIWRGSALIASSREGDVLGPRPANKSGITRAGWAIHTHEMPHGLTLVLGLPEDTRRQTLRVFMGSLLLASPLSILVAVFIGQVLGRRATRPLLDFTDRVSRVDPSGVLEPTQLKSAPREVRDLEDAFRRLLGRLTEAVSRELEFAANASHELRTPLTRIRLQAEQAWKDAGPGARLTLTAQMEEIDRIARLIDSLLVMSRDSAEGIVSGEVVNLADLVRGLLQRGPNAGSSHHGNLPDEVLVRGDEGLLSIAVENLLDNASKYGNDGTIVELLTQGRSGRMILTVTSPGSRVPAEVRDRLFERFYRDPEARALRPGHGLGLPLSRHIAHLHGGDVGCRSTEREDACFFLDLPLWEPTSAPPRSGP